MSAPNAETSTGIIIPSMEEILDAFENHRHSSIRVLGRLGIYYGPFNGYDIERSRFVGMTFVPGAPVEQLSRASAPWQNTEPPIPFMDDAEIPVRVLRPIDVEGEPAIGIRGITETKRPYLYRRADVTVSAFRRDGHSFRIEPHDKAV